MYVLYTYKQPQRPIRSAGMLVAERDGPIAHRRLDPIIRDLTRFLEGLSACSLLRLAHDPCGAIRRIVDREH